MKNKKILVVGVVLVLLALVAGVAFAGKGIKDGVWYVVIEGKSGRIGSTHTGYYMEVYNENDYRVRIWSTGAFMGSRELNAKQTLHFPAARDAEITNVERR
jgi:hypothetical protein